jgi:hypothetical protein
LFGSKGMSGLTSPWLRFKADAVLPAEVPLAGSSVGAASAGCAINAAIAQARSSVARCLACVLSQSSRAIRTTAAPFTPTGDAHREFSLAERQTGTMNRLTTQADSLTNCVKMGI